MIYSPEVPPPYPPANLWTHVELDIEPEPVLIDVAPGLRLPASWPQERRAAWLIRLDGGGTASA